MDIVNKDSYFNSIYSAIVVNDDYEQDPDGLYRVQIYIPTLFYELNNIYTEYMNSSDKMNSGNQDKFPWAKSLVKDLKNGNVVYGSFVNNSSEEFIILGLDANNPRNNPTEGEGTGYNINGTELLDLAMPIIIHNEVGINPSQWPEGISDSQYTNINPADNGGWSIGLIQWHHCRAYDVLDYIRTKDSKWESYWSDKSIDLYNDLKSGNNGNRTKYQASFHPTSGTPLYNGIKGMLGSDDGKTAQREYASKDTQAALDDLAQNYGITNPAVMIFVADIMNQYGNGIPATKQAAANACKNSNDVIGGLDAAIKAIKGVLTSYNTYERRRSTTYNYLKDLDSQGKFATGGLTDQGGEGNVIAGNGQYCMPFKGSALVTAGYGKGVNQGGQGYSNSYHSGIDFALPLNTPLYACTNGTIDTMGGQGLTGYSSGYGIGIKIRADDGNSIIYGHMIKRAVTHGTKVTKGQVIGYCDSTGHSTGNHLHFEVRNSGGTVVDPTPFLGIQNKRDVYVNA